ncbi:MAG TPA: hypothetical protein VFN18_12920 [Solirubrobacterales bacterium]|nr:hypothetical protein [Solirubrobacterales bacterium]
MPNFTITSDQRAVLYEEILACLTGVGDLLIAIEKSEFDLAQRLADEYSDYLRLLADDLGWGEKGAGTIELKSPPEVLRRCMERLRRRAEAEDHEISEQQAVMQEWEKRTGLIRLTCDQLLGDLSSAG